MIVPQCRWFDVGLKYSLPDGEEGRRRVLSWFCKEWIGDVVGILLAMSAYRVSERASRGNEQTDEKLGPPCKVGLVKGRDMHLS